MSDLKQDLVNLGYSEEQATSIVSKEKVYFQNNVDDITSKVRTTTEEKYSKNYVPRDEYNSLIRELRTNNVKSEFIKNGGNENYFNDFLKVNDDLLSVEGDVSKSVQTKLNNSPWARSHQPSLGDYGISEKPKEMRTSIYGKYDK